MTLTARPKSKDSKLSISKPSNANAGTGVPTSGDNPLFGTFHTFDTAPGTSNAALHVNRRFRNIDETDGLSGHSQGSGGEYETVSNNGSLSGESEDHKEKTSNLPIRQECLSVVDNDKREKIRQKNEKKHQRQKERRAQELHEKCNSYLMSRKLEALAEQLVSMGFSLEQATMALILNEGKVEESVAWLLEEGEEANKDQEQSLDTGDNLKIDISGECARMTDMEIRFNCSKQDVERAVVACKGDLEKAEDVLRSQKQELSAVLPNPQETSDPPTMGNDKVHPAMGSDKVHPAMGSDKLHPAIGSDKLHPAMGSDRLHPAMGSDKLHPAMGSDKLHPAMGTDKLPIGASQNLTRAPVKPSSSSTIPTKRDEKVFGYTEVVAPAGPLMDTGSQNVPLLKRAQPKLDRGKSPQVSVPVDKKWTNHGSNPPVSYSLSPSVQVSAPLAKTEIRYVAVGNELKNLQKGTVREPVTVMQRSQSVNARQTPTSNVSSSPPGKTAPFFPSNIVGAATSNGMISHIPVSRSLSMNSVSSNNCQLFNQLPYQQHQQPEQFFSSYGTLESSGTNQEYSLWSSPVGASLTQSTAAGPSHGLFSRLGPNDTYGLLSPVDWSTVGRRQVMKVDYRKIDWSLDGSLLSSCVDWSLDGGSSSSGTGGTLPTNQPTTDSLMQHYDPRYDAFYRGPANSTAGPVLPDDIDVLFPGLQSGASTAETAAADASREWTSPFEERDLFSLPRQFISSASL